MGFMWLSQSESQSKDEETHGQSVVHKAISHGRRWHSSGQEKWLPKKKRKGMHGDCRAGWWGNKIILNMWFIDWSTNRRFRIWCVVLQNPIWSRLCCVFHVMKPIFECQNKSYPYLNNCRKIVNSSHGGNSEIAEPKNITETTTTQSLNLHYCLFRCLSFTMET